MGSGVFGRTASRDGHSPAIRRHDARNLIPMANELRCDCVERKVMRKQMAGMYKNAFLIGFLKGTNPACRYIISNGYIS